MKPTICISASEIGHHKSTFENIAQACQKSGFIIHVLGRYDETEK